MREHCCWGRAAQLSTAQCSAATEDGEVIFMPRAQFVISDRSCRAVFPSSSPAISLWIGSVSVVSGATVTSAPCPYHLFWAVGLRDSASKFWLR